MDILRAKDLLETLADGVNPFTGEILPENDSCNHVEVVRALHTVLKYLELKQEKSTKKRPENSGKPWKAEDDEILCRMFDSNCSNREICEYFKRTQASIAARLVRLGKISERDEFRRR